jgi:hypothetical protein
LLQNDDITVKSLLKEKSLQLASVIGDYQGKLSPQLLVGLSAFKSIVWVLSTGSY